MKYYFYSFKNQTGRRASVREFITRQTCKIGGEFTKTLRKVCTCQKLKFSFLLLEYCKIIECYAVANAFTIRNMYSLFLYMKCNSRKINRPTKNKVILTNFFAEPTVLLVPITSRDCYVTNIFDINLATLKDVVDLDI
jgi:hypothetical protein